jgi:ribosome-associated protein
VITAQEHRSQERNRAAALAALVDLLRRATVTPKHRVATKPGNAAKERRLQAKSHRSVVKRTRASRIEI